jgi:hypothetical protein
MKKTLLKIGAFLLLFALVGISCKKDEEDLSYLDKNIKFYPTEPGFSIYKTKNDYFFNVPVSRYMNTYYTRVIDEDCPCITLYKGKYYFNERYRLINGYILDSGGVDDVFTSLSFDTYIREKLSPEFNQWVTNPKVINSIIDQDPFVEFYYSDKNMEDKGGFTISDLNQLIKENQLEKYFIRQK